MARTRLTEYAAKSILAREGILKGWKGIEIQKATQVKQSIRSLREYFGDVQLVVKVDQGVKQRGKRGLMQVGLTPSQVLAFIARITDFSHFLIEPAYAHAEKDEQYLSIERIREGFRVLYSARGGVEIEENWQDIQTYILEFPISNFKFQNKTPIPNELLAISHKLSAILDRYDWSFIEINPLVIDTNAGLHILDCAVLVDSVAPITLTDPLTKGGLIPDAHPHPAETTVAQLQAGTPASLKLTILHPDGSIWMLLSGGGASIVLADEVADLGRGRELANYGEYSGNPSREDVAAYASAIADAMIQSKAKRKVLIIAGGVANFTDIRATLVGVVDGLKGRVTEMKAQHISVFVRRGGPNQVAGLAYVKSFFDHEQIPCEVYDQTLPLTDIVKKAIKTLQ